MLFSEKSIFKIHQVTQQIISHGTENNAAAYFKV